MKRKHCINGANEVTEVDEDGVKHEIHKSSGGVKLGDLIWVKLHSSSWWPAQVVDADTVSKLIKPSERSVGEVLVRVYGSYIYLYVDPLESRTEFDKVLKLYNGNYDQILKESLSKDRLHLSESEGLAASEATNSVGDVSPETSTGATPEHENNAQGKEDDDPSRTRISDYVPEQNSRKLRSRTNHNILKKNNVMIKKESSADAPMSVRPDASTPSERIMQNLGLIAPYGSPFNLKQL